MKRIGLATILLFLIATVQSYGAQAAKNLITKPGCENVLLKDAPDPLSEFFNEFDLIRKSGKSDTDLDRALWNHLMAHEFLQSMAGSAKFQFVKEMISRKRAATASIGILERLMKAEVRRTSDLIPAFQPLFKSVEELQKHFDPKRVVEIPIKPDLFQDIFNGVKTVTVRKGHRWEIKTGPGVFYIPGTKKQINVKISRVKFRVRPFDLKEEDLIGSGVAIAETLHSQGLYPAMNAMFKSLQTIYPDLEHDDDLTVIHFIHRVM